MRALRAWLHRAIGLVAPGRREHDLDEEIASHLQMHIDDNVRAGMTREEARRQALVTFGPVEAIKDAHRDRRSLPRLRDVGRDVTYAARLLRKSPGYAGGVIATIAMAVGVNVAIFTVFNAAALRPFNVPGGDRLVTVSLRIEGNRSRGVHGMPSLLATPEFLAVRDDTRAFSGALAFSPFNSSTLGGAEPQQIQTTIA